MHFASEPCAAVSFAVGFAAYSELLPQSTTLAFILEEVAANGVLMEYHSMMVWWQDRFLNVVSLFLGQLRVIHGNLSCRKGYILHTELFHYGKFALQIRICWPLFIII